VRKVKTEKEKQGGFAVVRFKTKGKERSNEKERGVERREDLDRGQFNVGKKEVDDQGGNKGGGKKRAKSVGRKK